MSSVAEVLTLRRSVLRMAMVGFGALAMAGGEARAQDYPNRVITIVVPYVAGGPTDAAIRVATQRLGAALGQQVIIENVGSAGGTTGTMRVARAAPDGYTLLAQQTGIATIAGLYPQLAIDVVKELAPIGMINRNEYKRRQAPPGVKITPRAFGRDRRLPLASKYQGY